MFERPVRSTKFAGLNWVYLFSLVGIDIASLLNGNTPVALKPEVMLGLVIALPCLVEKVTEVILSNAPARIIMIKLMAHMLQRGFKRRKAATIKWLRNMCSVRWQGKKLFCCQLDSCR